MRNRIPLLAEFQNARTQCRKSVGLHNSERLSIRLFFYVPLSLLRPHKLATVS